VGLILGLRFYVAAVVAREGHTAGMANQADPGL
jgi:hypothetical protein